MGYDGAGNYSRTHNFSADGSAGIKILAARMDAEFNDFASAMSLPVLRDGQNVPTANLPMGGFRHVGVGAPASATNYMRSKDFIENVPIYVVDAEASADRISVSATFYTTASATTAPRDGSHLLIKAGSDKSSAVAIRLNTGDGNPHSANVILTNSSAIYSGAIRSGGIYEFIWSSSDTAWQLMNPQVDYANETYPGVIMIATTAEVATGTNATKAVTPQLMAAKFSASYATVTSAGLVELATTAEAIVGDNISVALTPAGAKAAYGSPYVVVARYLVPAVSVVSRNQAAVSCTVSVTGGIVRFVYGSALTSSNGAAIKIFTETSTYSRVSISQLARDASGFSFIVIDGSTGSAIGAVTASVFLNFEVDRL